LRSFYTRVWQAAPRGRGEGQGNCMNLRDSEVYCDSGRQRADGACKTERQRRAVIPAQGNALVSGANSGIGGLKARHKVFNFPSCDCPGGKEHSRSYLRPRSGSTLAWPANPNCCGSCCAVSLSIPGQSVGGPSCRNAKSSRTTHCGPLPVRKGPQSQSCDRYTHL
jgi:hypothetical protein